MKTSSTFNKVINDAGQLALTEGHTALASSPRVTPRGLLSFQGDIVKTQRRKVEETIENLEGDILEGELTDAERREVKKQIKALKKTVKKITKVKKINENQTWPIDTIVLIPSEGGPLRISGVAVIYDREAKVYRRDPNPVKPSDELVRF